MGFVVSVATGMVTGVVTSGVVAGGRVREVGTSVTGGSAGLVVMATGETAGCPVIFPAGRFRYIPAERSTMMISITGRCGIFFQSIMFPFLIPPVSLYRENNCGRSRSYPVRGKRACKKTCIVLQNKESARY